MRIWDLRRGDADDNRTSPAGRGLRSVVLSAVLEFNYVHASIGFLALVIGPALLVGIMPSVVVTYGRLKIHDRDVGRRQSDRRARLVGGAGGSCALDRPAAFGHGGRQLLASPLYPCFSALRGAARAPARAGGRVRGRSSPPAQFDRGRRIGYRPGRTAAWRRGAHAGHARRISFGLQFVDVSTSVCGP